MKIKVEDNLYIESDHLQFYIRKYSGKTDKDGRETYNVLGYFSSLNQAIKYLAKHKVMKSDATTVQELLNDLRRIENRINELVRV
jgi:uncharacterized lipoprotein YajG